MLYYVLHRVRNKKYRLAVFLVVIAYLAEYLFPAYRVKSCRRLVKDKYLGIHCDNTCKCDTAFLSARKVKRRAFEKLLTDTHIFCRLTHSAVDLGFIASHILRTVCYILVHRFFKQLILGILEYKSYSESYRAYINALAPYILTVYQHFTRRRLYKSVQVLDKR